MGRRSREAELLAEVYVETNFLMGLAKAQDPIAEELLHQELAGVRFLVPGVCYMEALAALKTQSRQHKDFLANLNRFPFVKDALRDASDKAKSVTSQLEQFRIHSQSLLNEIEMRLHKAIDRLAQISDPIPLVGSVVKEAISTPICEDMTDNLILHCIVHHARSNCSESLLPRAFFSGNSRDFDGNRDASRALKAAKLKYFSKSEELKNWLDSLQSEG